ncbi:MAG TPA: radical SAM protein [Elusimicrobiota bacterium]|nr:radical SAM protein [Elusimicrobiota bacterium]
MTGSARRAWTFASRLAAGVLSPGRLSYLVLFVTDDCNARCPHCFNVFLPHLKKEGPPAGGPPLTLDEYALVAGKLAPLFQVVLSGGEPFLRDDLHAIVETFYARAGARLFSLPTNGSLPDRALGQLERMSAACPDASFNLIVSLDACGAKHDELRRLRGGFEKAVGLCRSVLELGRRRRNVGLVVTTAVAEANLDDVPELVGVLRRTLPPAGWKHNIQYDQRLGSRLARDPALRRKVGELETLAARAAGGSLWDRAVDRWYVRFVNSLILHQLSEDRMIYRCAAGRKLAVLMPDGSASPCEPFVFEERYRAFPRFDIRRHGYDLGALRRDPEFARLLRFIAEGRCAACPWSCAAIASVTYDWRNWGLPFTVPSASRSPRG